MRTLCVAMLSAWACAQPLERLPGEGRQPELALDGNVRYRMVWLFDHYLRGKKTDRTFDRFPSEAELDAALAAAKR